MAIPSWLNPYNYVTILQGGVPVVIQPSGDQLLPAGTVQVTPNSEIPAASLANPPAGVSVNVLSPIPNQTPGAQS
jgi:hypothetical protein